MRRSVCVVPVVAFGLLVATWAPSTSQVLSLEQAIAIATDVSTAVGQSREQLQVSRQQVLNNWGRFVPNLNLNSFAGHSYAGPGSARVDEQGRPIQPAGFDYEAYSFGLSSSMMLFDWGANIKHLKSSERAAEASEYGLQYQKDVVTAQVIRAYYFLVRDEYLILVQEESVRAAQRNLDQVEAFFSIGSNTKADVLQAKVRLGNTQLALISAKNAAEISQATVASLLNYPINQAFEVDTALARAAAAQEVEVDLDHEVEYMLEHRPDLLGTRKLVSSASDNVTAVEHARWPTISGNWNYSWSDRSFPPNANFFETQYSWFLGVSLNWAIFDRFQTKSAILNAKARERIAEYNLQQAKLDATLEVKTIYLSLTEAQERGRVAQETTNHAAENLRLAEERYRVGAGTILETNDAQVQFTQARSELVRAKCDYLIARADLQRATGRPVKVQ